MKMLNVFTSGLALTAIAAIVAACSSQDTMTGRKYTDAEVKQFCAKDANVQACVTAKLLPAKAAGKTDAAGTQAAVVAKDGSAPKTDANGAPIKTSEANPAPGAVKAPTEKAFVPKAASEQPNLFKKDGKLDSASNKLLIEYADQNDLLEANQAALDGAINEDAKVLVRGLTVHAAPAGAGVSLSLESAVTINGEKMNLFVKDAQVAFSKDGKVPEIAINLQDLTGEPKDPAHQVKVSAICTGQECVEVQLRFDFLFENDTKTVPAVFMLEKANNFEIVASNLGDVTALPTFEAALSGVPAKPVAGKPAAQLKVPQLMGPPAPTATPKVDGGSSATPKKEQAPTTTPKASPAPATPGKQGSLNGTDAAGFHASVAKLQEKSASTSPFKLAPGTSSVVAQHASPKSTSSSAQNFANLVNKTNSGTVAQNFTLKPQAPTSMLAAAPPAPAPKPVQAAQVAPTTKAPVKATASAPTFNPISGTGGGSAALFAARSGAPSTFTPISTTGTSASLPAFTSLKVPATSAAAPTPTAATSSGNTFLAQRGSKATQARKELAQKAGTKVTAEAGALRTDSAEAK